MRLTDRKTDGQAEFSS